MAEVAQAAVQVAVEVARIASTPESVEARAEALLEPLRRVVPFQAARISLVEAAGARLVIRPSAPLPLRSRAGGPGCARTSEGPRRSRPKLNRPLAALRSWSVAVAR